MKKIPTMMLAAALALSSSLAFAQGAGAGGVSSGTAGIGSPVGGPGSTPSTTTGHGVGPALIERQFRAIADSWKILKRFAPNEVAAVKGRKLGGGNNLCDLPKRTELIRPTVKPRYCVARGEPDDTLLDQRSTFG